jgi:hypothetical protein
MQKDMFIIKPSDIFPILGGASGSYVAIEHTFISHWYGFVIMTVAGAVIGYFVKLILDCIIKKIKKS